MVVKLEMLFDSMSELRDFVTRTGLDDAAPVVGEAEVQKPKAKAKGKGKKTELAEAISEGAEENKVVAFAAPQAAPAPVPAPAPAPVPEVLPTPAPVQEEAPASTFPTTVQAEQKFSMDDLARAGAALVDQGMQATILSLLAKYGVPSLPELHPSRYDEFALDLRACGAPI